jgi:hypothetical protein
MYSVIALAAEYEIVLPPHVQEMVDLVGAKNVKPPSDGHNIGVEKGSKEFANLVARMLDLGGARRAVG